VKSATHTAGALWSATHNITISRAEKADSRVRELGLLVSENNPLAVLQKGYARVFATDGNDLTSAKKLRTGDRIRVKMSDGEKEAICQ